jgi:hypothetical protein
MIFRRFDKLQVEDLNLTVSTTIFMIGGELQCHLHNLAFHVIEVEINTLKHVFNPSLETQ